MGIYATPHELDFPSLEEVRRDLKVRWYRCPIDPARLRELMKRSDLQGAFQTLGHLGLFTVTGIATAYCFINSLWLPFCLALWCHGTVGRFFAGLATHELGHGTVWRTKWLNGFFLRVFSVLSWHSHNEYAISHTYHHRYTLFPDGDREVLLPQPTGLRALAVIELLTVNVRGVASVFGPTFRHAFRVYNTRKTGLGGSEWTRALFDLAPEVERKTVRWARITIACHAAVLAVSAIFGVWWLSIVLTGYAVVGRWLVFLVGRPMHLGLRDNVPDFRLCVRSNRLDPFTSFLYWRMNWHTEHHMFAGVPCYNLKKLAKEIEADMPRLRSLWECWREMLQIERRQRDEPDYQYDTPLPPTAHPAVERADELTLPKGERLELEASIGELAPEGR